MKKIIFIIAFALICFSDNYIRCEENVNTSFTKSILHKSYAFQALSLDTIQDKIKFLPYSIAIAKYKELYNWAQAHNDQQLENIVKLKRYYLYLNRNNKYPNFEKEINELIKHYDDENLLFLKAEALQLLGFYYLEVQNNKGLVLEYYHYAYSIYDKYTIDEFPYKAEYLYQLAGRYYFFRDYESAKKYYLEVWNTIPFNKIDNPVSKLNTVGMCYSNLEKLDSSNLYFNKALHYAYQNNNELWIGIISGNLGSNYFKEQRYDESEKLLLKNIEISTKHKQKVDLAQALSKYGDLLLLKKDIKNALIYQLKSLAIVWEKKMSYQDSYRIFPNVAKAYAANGKFDLAYAYQDTAYMAKDAYEKARNSIILAGVQLKIELEKHKSEIRQNEDEVANQKLYRNFFIIAFFLILIASTLFFFQQRRYKKAQIKLFLSEKLAALGQVSAGVAHEVNTPLGAIKSSAEESILAFPEFLKNFEWFNNELSDIDKKLFVKLLSESNLDGRSLSTKEERELKKIMNEKLIDLKVDNARFLSGKMVQVGIFEISPTIETLAQNPHFEKLIIFAYNILNQQRNSLTIKLAVDKASRVVKALKTYLYTSSNNKMEEINIQENIETVLTIYNNRLKQGVQVIKNYEQVPIIMGFPDKLNQVWTNLIVNAVQAMDNKGTLTINIKNEDAFVLVSIQDNGKGIPKKIQSKIFDPFFTTKSSGEGTGIGLDISQKILKEHNSTIWFETQEDVGTTFYIKIPIK